MAAGVAASRRAAIDKGKLAAALQSNGALPVDSPIAIPYLLDATSKVTGGSIPGTLPKELSKAALPPTDPFGTAAAQRYIKQIEELIKQLTSTLPANKDAVATELSAQAVKDIRSAKLDFVVFLLNFLAFLGYGMFPLTFFFSEAEVQKVIPVWPGHAWVREYGNLLGDFSWTVEPTLILLISPLLHSAYLSSSSKKVKSE